MDKIITLAKGITIAGDINSENSLRLEGHVEGNGLVKGTLYIAPGAFWEGNLMSDLAIIQGIVQGDISAQQVMMLPGSSVTGTVFSPRVQIRSGAVFNGLLRMRAQRKLTRDGGNVALYPGNRRRVAAN